MCGITGWIDWHQDLTQQVFIVEKMANTLAKRGPDASNVWSSRHLLLGHTRLIVVDPAGGIQPMAIEKNNHTFTIVYNGELYNTEEIRKELLQRGYSFQSYSDTEVLLTAYIEWGEDCVEHLNGIFAFAVWDQHGSSFLWQETVLVSNLYFTVKKTDRFCLVQKLKRYWHIQK